VITGAAHTAPACPSTNVRSQSFPKRKTVQSACRALSRATPGAASLKLTCDMWFWVPQILQLYLFTTPLTWNVASSEKHTWRRKSGDASILSSIFIAKFVRATWSLGLSARIIWIFYAFRQSILCSTSCTVEREICTQLQASRTNWLHELRWNASLMRLAFSSEVHVFPGDSTCNRLPVVLSLLSQSRTIFLVGGRRPYCVLKRRWTAVRDCNSASHNTHWTRYSARSRSPAGACV
jgi:hypothetical protein